MKYDKARVKKICELLEGGNTREDSAILSGIHKDTFYEWLKNKADFSDAIKEAEARGLAQHIANVRRHAFGLDGQAIRWTASAWWLERTHPERFGQKWQGELSGRNGKPLIPEGKPTVDLSRLTDEQLKMMGTNLAAVIKSAKDPEAHTNGNGNGNGSAG